MPGNFFELQAQARRASLALIPVYLLAMVAVAFAISVVLAMSYAILILYLGDPVPAGIQLDYGSLISSYFRVLFHAVPPHFHAWVGGIAMLVMVCAAIRRMWQLRAGGGAVAELMGAEQLSQTQAKPAEQRLLNVVEEMAIASGIVVPPVYVLRGQRGINALAAGFSPNQAVIIATEGAVANLTRDELQGVIGHEMSHILNGDIRLNVRLLGYLYGIVFVWQTGKEMIRTATAGAIRVQREKQSLNVFLLVLGTVLTVVGGLGVLCARLIQAAISRQREFLADAASVQFTRNPNGIAGALDTVLHRKLTTLVQSPHAEEMSHMYFGPGSVNMLGPAFATHPAIEERIRRVNPLFRSEKYRATRPQSQEENAEVAVIDGGGNVVESLGMRPMVAAAIVATAGEPTRAHIDFAARLAAAIPAKARERLASPEGALQLCLALQLQNGGEESRAQRMAVLEARRGADFARAIEAARQEIESLSRAFRLPLAALLVPELKAMAASERDRLVADLLALALTQHRLSLSEFALILFIKQQMQQQAGRSVAIRFRSIREVAPDAQRVLSLVAHAAAAETNKAFLAGVPELGIELLEPLSQGELTLAKLELSLGRLRQLAPLEQPRIIKACLKAACADGVLRIEEVELVRTVASVLDCPLPPVLLELDPEKLAP